MSQHPDWQGQPPGQGQPPSLSKGPEQYPQAPPPGPYQPQDSYPAAPGPVGYGPGPGQGYGGQQRRRNGLGITALVLGILSIPLGFFIFPLGILLGVLAVIFGAVGMNRAKRGQATNRGQAIAGLVTGLIGAAIGLTFLIFAINVFRDCSDQVGANATSEEIQQCVTDQVTN